ncbi:MAG: hypothetical protein KGS44_12745 [Alphaproteobacteria bacterium]|nr:hypothetical protein [Alphaproteobacteria bacterium]
MMRLAIAALALLVTGCAAPNGPTNAQREARDINLAVDQSRRQSAECADNIERSPDYRALTGRFVLGRPPMDVLANRNRPTGDDVPLLLAVHKSLAACRADVLQRVSTIHPAFVTAAAETYTEADMDFARLVRREISYGQYAELSLARINRFDSRNRAAAEKIEASLGRAQAQEREDRQRATRVLQEWTNVQRTSLPTFTTCSFTTGNIVTCSSY